MTSVLAIQRFADLLRLRAGPQDLPASNAVLLVTVAAAAVLGTLAIQRVYSPEMAGVRVALDLLLQLAFVFGALRVTGHPERLRQTYAALCGTTAFLVLLAWPLVGVMLDRPQGDSLGMIAALFLMGVYGWSVVVVGHILRHALDLTLGKAIVVALAYILAAGVIAAELVPPAEPLQ